MTFPLGKGHGGLQMTASKNLDTHSQRLHVPARNLQRLCNYFWLKILSFQTHQRQLVRLSELPIRQGLLALHSHLAGSKSFLQTDDFPIYIVHS